MLKQLSKITATVLLGTALTSAVFASDAYYGMPKAKLAAAANGTSGTVVLHNYTNDIYDVSWSYFYPSVKRMPVTTLYQNGSGMDVITYDIDRPDTAACLIVIRSSDRYLVYGGCPQNGDVNIGPYTSNDKPLVKVVSRENG
jgi:hypothetical protein